MAQLFKRLELHNHTTESDASITCKELLEYMESDHADAFALTDHNTISGHKKMAELLSQKDYHTQCIYGMEYTTYYGHILCLNLLQYVPWDSIDKNHPELLFEAVRKTGALAGIAHPFSYGYPFATGCRFEMTVTDYSAVDFIEIFNDPEPLHEVNEKGLLMWEELVLNGHPLAATCGMDLHGKWNMAGEFATFIEGEENGAVAKELDIAVRSGKTWVSKGPLVLSTVCPEQEEVCFELRDGKKNGCPVDPNKSYILSLRTSAGTIEKILPVDAPLTISYAELFGDQKTAAADAENGCKSAVVVKLYEEESVLEQLVCVAPVLRL